MIRRLAALAAGSRPQLALSVVLGFLAIASSLALMATSGFLISKAALRPPILDLAVAIVAVRAFGIGRGIFRYLERVTSHDLALRLLSELRVWLYRHLEPLAPAGLEEFRSGDLLARMVADVEALQDFFLRVLAPPMVAALVLGLAIGVVLSVAPLGVVALCVPFLLAGLALPWLARHLARPLAAAHTWLRGELSVELVELLQGAPEIAAFGRQGEQLDRIQRLDTKLARTGRGLASLSGLLEGSVVTLAGLAVGGVLALTVPLTSTGRIDGVYLAMVALATLASFEAVQQLPDAFGHLEQSLAAAARLFKIGDCPAPVTDPAQSLPVESGLITLQDAWLRYRSDGPWALAGVNLHLEPGSRVALIGPSGSGKTTVANVLVRFRELDRGQATLGSHDLRDYRQDDVRRVVGLCEQDPHIFNTTILANVRLARPTATQDELDEAAGHARVLDWIRSLPDGWDTRVGEAGAMVSGGQRQRISMARALLADFPILILDEPTANLDRELARELMADIVQATSGRSLLLITHRLEGLEAMDQILVMEQGQIVERGSHDELLAAGGRYHEMRAFELTA